MRKSTWIILGLVIALSAIYFFTRENTVSVGVKRLKLPTFLADKIDRIEIKSAKNNVVLVKLTDNWELELKDKDGKPYLVKADNSNVTSMLEAALALESSHYITNLQEKFKDLGVEGDDAVSIKIFSNNSPIWDLILGKNAGSSGRYAKLPDSDDVFAVRGSFFNLTRNDVTDFREREIMPIKEGEITSFKMVKSGEPFIALTKEKDSEEWNVDESAKALPKGFRIDKSALSSLVRAPLNIRASGFVDDENMVLKSPLLSVFVVADNAKYELDFFAGASKDQYLAKRKDDKQIYEISKFNFERINKPLDELRDLSLLKFDKNAIVKLTLAHGKNQVVIDKKDNKWHIEEPVKLPKDFEFDEASVDDMLTMLSNLTADRVANPAKDVAQDANWQKTWLVELVTDKGEKVHLMAGKSKTNKDEYLAKGNIDHEIYVVKGSRLGSLNLGINAFKKEEFELPPVDEHTHGFESLPVDVQRKLLEATKKKK